MQPEDKREVSVYHKSSLKKGSRRIGPMDVSTAWRKMSIWTSVGSSRKRRNEVAAVPVVVGVDGARVRLLRSLVVSSSLDASRECETSAGPSFQPWSQITLGGC